MTLTDFCADLRDRVAAHQAAAEEAGRRGDPWAERHHNALLRQADELCVVARSLLADFRAVVQSVREGEARSRHRAAAAVGRREEDLYHGYAAAYGIAAGELERVTGPREDGRAEQPAAGAEGACLVPPLPSVMDALARAPRDG